MSSHNNRHLLAGTPAGVQRSKNPVSVRKLKMDFNEPFYTNNKVGNEYFTLEKSCGNTCEICPMLRPLFTIQALQASAAGPAPQGGPRGPQGSGAPKPRSLGVPEPRGLGAPEPWKPDDPRGPKGHPPPLLTQFYVLTYSH